jgi:hypothetical protein
MYIQNRRDSSKFNACSPLQLSCNLTGKCHAIAYFAYTNRWWLFKYQMNLSRTTILFVLLFGQFSCYRDNSAFPEHCKYIGFWAETKWTYNFDQDGRYTLESKGHGGGEPKSGEYIKKDSLIILISDSEFFEDMRLKRMKISEDGCLRDYWNHIYCENEDLLVSTAEKVFEEELLMENAIGGLDTVQRKREDLLRQDSLIKYTLQFEGIVLINDNEYFEYNLKSWLTEYRRYQIHLRFYSKFDPIRIYDDDLTLIKKYETATNIR